LVSPKASNPHLTNNHLVFLSHRNFATLFSENVIFARISSGI
jgi:hypothetical protein